MAFKESKKWAEWLPAAEWWYNTSYHTSLKTSPFEALYGYSPPQLHDIAVPCDVSPEVQVTLQEKDRILKSPQQNLMQAQNRMKEYDIPVPQWPIHWENMSLEEATWEDAKFIEATFPTFQP
jgi:hypothetical protein